jgi:hypothetical protein
MTGHVHTPADVLPEDPAPAQIRLPGLNPAGSAYSSAPAGIFSQRRARYFNETGMGLCLTGVADVKKA